MLEDSPDRDTSIPDLFRRSSRPQQSHTGLPQALGELDEIRFVVHREQGFDTDRKRVPIILSGSNSPIGVDIVFSSPGSKKIENASRVWISRAGTPATRQDLASPGRNHTGLSRVWTAMPGRRRSRPAARPSTEPATACTLVRHPS